MYFVTGTYGFSSSGGNFISFLDGRGIIIARRRCDGRDNSVHHLHRYKTPSDTHTNLNFLRPRNLAQNFISKKKRKQELERRRRNPRIQLVHVARSVDLVCYQRFPLFLMHQHQTPFTHPPTFRQKLFRDGTVRYRDTGQTNQ